MLLIGPDCVGHNIAGWGTTSGGGGLAPMKTGANDQALKRGWDVSPNGPRVSFGRSKLTPNREPHQRCGQRLGVGREKGTGETRRGGERPLSHTSLSVFLPLFLQHLKRLQNVAPRRLESRLQGQTRYFYQFKGHTRYFFKFRARGGVQPSPPSGGVGQVSTPPGKVFLLFSVQSAGKNLKFEREKKAAQN